MSFCNPFERHTAAYPVVGFNIFMFQSANRAMAGNAEASELSLLDTLLKTYEIQDNFKTLTPFYVECA